MSKARISQQYSTKTNWQLCPELFRKTVSIGKAKKPNLTIKAEVAKLLNNIVGTDELRPILSGVYYDKAKKAIVATNAHVLVKIHYPTLHDGAYTPSGEKIEDRYPDYNAIIPNYAPQWSGKIDIFKWMAFMRATVMFSNSTTHSVFYKTPAGIFGCNTELATDLITTMLNLGCTDFTADYHSHKKALIIHSSTGDTEVTGLLMPVMPYLQYNEPYLAAQKDKEPFIKYLNNFYEGTEDMDWDYQFNSCYNLFTGDVTSLNEDGSISTTPLATVDKPAGQWNLSPEMIKAIYAGRAKSNTLDILNNAAIHSGSLHITDLDTQISIPCTGVDGIYRITPLGLLRQPDYKIDDFPRYRIDKWEKVLTLRPDHVKSLVLAQYCADFKDGLRDYHTAISLMSNGKDLVEIISTNSFAVYIDNTGIKQADVSISIRGNTLLVKWLEEASGDVTVYVNYTEGKVKLEAGNMTIINKLIERKMPKVGPHLFNSINQKVTFTTSDLKDLVKAAKANTRAAAYFDFDKNTVALKNGSEKIVHINFETTPADTLPPFNSVMYAMLYETNTYDGSNVVPDIAIGFPQLLKIEKYISADMVECYLGKTNANYGIAAFNLDIAAVHKINDNQKRIRLARAKAEAIILLFQFSNK